MKFNIFQFARETRKDLTFFNLRQKCMKFDFLSGSMDQFINHKQVYADKSQVSSGDLHKLSGGSCKVLYQVSYVLA